MVKGPDEVGKGSQMSWPMKIVCPECRLYTVPKIHGKGMFFCSEECYEAFLTGIEDLLEDEAIAYD